MTTTEDRYHWVALANTAAAMFMATLDPLASPVNMSPGRRKEHGDQGKRRRMGSGVHR